MNNNCMQIIIVGLSCSGKDTLGEYINHRYKVKHISASDHAKKISRIDGSIIDSNELANTVDDYLKKCGKAKVAEYIYNKYLKNNDTNRSFVITGFRYKEEYEYIKKRFSNLILISVSADLDVRFKRNLIRARQGYMKDKSKFRELDLLQNEMGLIPFSHIDADYKLINSTTFDDLFAKTSKILD